MHCIYLIYQQTETGRGNSELKGKVYAFFISYGKKHESWKNESLQKNDVFHIAKRSWWHCLIIVVVVVIVNLDIFFASVSNCLQRTCIVTCQFSSKPNKTKQKPLLPLLEIDLKLAALIMGSSCCSVLVWAQALLQFGTSGPRKGFL